MPDFVRTSTGNVIRPEHCRHTIHMALGDGRAREGVRNKEGCCKDLCRRSTLSCSLSRLITGNDTTLALRPGGRGQPLGDQDSRQLPHPSLSTRNLWRSVSALSCDYFYSILNSDCSSEASRLPCRVVQRRTRSKPLYLRAWIYFDRLYNDKGWKNFTFQLVTLKLLSSFCLHDYLIET